MIRRALALALAIVLPSFAGCLASRDGDVAPAGGGPASRLDAQWFVRGVPWGEGHVHADPTHHLGLSTPNFEVVGHDALTTDFYGTTLNGMGCGGTAGTEDGRRLAVVHSISTDVSFVVADVTDPARPTMLGEYYLPNVVVWDATITADGTHAVVGAYRAHPASWVLPVSSEGAPVQPMWRDACTGATRAAGPEQYVPYGPSVLLVSLADAENPVLADVVPQPLIGPHSVSSQRIDGVTYVISSVTNLVHAASYYAFFTLGEGPRGGKLAPWSVIEAPGTSAPTRFNGHVDAELRKHPATGQLLAYLANWNEGVAIYDMADPRLPRLLSTWRDGAAGSLHEAYPLEELWDGRHYTIAGQEVGEPVDLPSGWVYVLDTTDPEKPFEVSRWTLPVKPKWDGGLQFSTHYVEVVNRTLFVANYHGGVWAVDLSNVENPRAIGLFVPDRVPASPYATCPCEPSVEDVIASPDGVLTVWDAAGGIYQLRFDAADPAPPAPAWAEAPAATAR